MTVLCPDETDLKAASVNHISDFYASAKKLVIHFEFCLDDEQRVAAGECASK